jgi:hypothetical protein
VHAKSKDRITEQHPDSSRISKGELSLQHQADAVTAIANRPPIDAAKQVWHQLPAATTLLLG